MKSIPIIGKPIYCKSCFKPFRPAPSRLLLEDEPLLCDDCISQIDTKMETKELFGIKVVFLSGYGGIMERWLMNYKEYGDLEIAPCFLQLFLPYLRLRFPSSLYLPLPSSDERIKHRGFSHLEEMLSSVGLPYETVFQKGGREQKERLGLERKERQGISWKEKAMDIQGKNVVLYDDVLTTGSTFRECLELVKAKKPKHISGLILMDNFRVEDLKIHT